MNLTDTFDAKAVLKHPDKRLSTSLEDFVHNNQPRANGYYRSEIDGLMDLLPDMDRKVFLTRLGELGRMVMPDGNVLINGFDVTDAVLHGHHIRRDWELKGYYE